MAKSLTRKQILESAAQRVGNAAAHRVVYPDSAGTREANLYEQQARVVIEQRGWNDREIVRFREIAIRRAKKELAQRVRIERGIDLADALEDAVQIIEMFILKELQK